LTGFNSYAHFYKMHKKHYRKLPKEGKTV